MQKESIVSTNGQQAFTNSLIVAKGCPTERKNKQSGEITLHDRDHRDVLKLVKQYQAEFEEFNPLRFETALGKKLPQGGYGQETEYAILSEDQATYLITLFTNTAIVRKFKRDLVKAFRKALDGRVPSEYPIIVPAGFTLAFRLLGDFSSLSQHEFLITGAFRN